ncbi:response regulator transcription factor [Aliifodinibius salicampi]|uniref:Response regulator transcription factor n=1 Tax=Fodinibius salicampi TaxID=1920655 RepID=A0ABT3Q2J4_9BACT|nr:response regulator transcription factor [Fodinibius salicampi]MCW9714228.1 response regulator transcription factor [Fodinibius salicampi]
MAPISILIAEDHEIVRFGISTYLSSAEDITVVGEASTGEECLKLFEQTQPDVCLLDIGMPDKDGIETAGIIRSLDPDVKILILSMHIDRQKLADVLEAGVDGYLLKDTDKSDILHGIRAIMRGQRVFSPPISDMITESFLNKEEISPPKVETDLTKREREILELIVQGMTSKEIAKELYISPRTVDTHRSNLMEKLELKNIADLVRFALKNKLVSA